MWPTPPLAELAREGSAAPNKLRPPDQRETVGNQRANRRGRCEPSINLTPLPMAKGAVRIIGQENNTPKASRRKRGALQNPHRPRNSLHPRGMRVDLDL